MEKLVIQGKEQRTITNLVHRPNQDLSKYTNGRSDEDRCRQRGVETTYM